MANINLPIFENLDPESLEEYYDVYFDFNNTQVQIDLNFDNKSIDIKRLDIVKRFINNIRIHDLNNKKFIKQDFDNKNGETARIYVENHLAELALDDLDNLIGSDSKSNDKPGLLLNKLHLVRVGLYPDSEEQFAIFDYTIGKELTDYLVVINTDENGNLDYMTIES